MGKYSLRDLCSLVDAVLQVGSSVRYSHGLYVHRHYQCDICYISNVCQSSGKLRLNNRIYTSNQSAISHAFHNLFDRHRRFSSGTFCIEDFPFWHALQHQAVAGSRPCHRSKVSRNRCTGRKRMYASRAWAICPHNGHLSFLGAYHRIILSSQPLQAQSFQ